jgi:hypothetical protein
MESTGPFGCLDGLIIACLLTGALALVFILGFITLTIAVWVGCGVLLLAVISVRPMNCRKSVSAVKF